LGKEFKMARAFLSIFTEIFTPWNRTSCMKKTSFDDSWKFWIWDNVKRGSSKRELAQILLDKGFDENLIIQEFSMPDILKKVEGISPPVKIEDLTAKFGAEKISDKLNIFKIKNALTQDQCSRAIEIIKNRCQKSSVIDYDNGGSKISDFRTSSTAHLFRNSDPTIAEIEDAILNIVGIPEQYSEQVQGQYYKVGEQFKPHFDSFFPLSDDQKKQLERHGNRTWTAMVYLNDTPKGGHTRFTEIDLETKPETGTMILWQNTREGSNIPESKHWGMPVEEGEKFILTKWFREKPYQNLS
jgi:prolyl 4-hydroxylase